MSGRKYKFEIGEFYHVYNRGIEGRNIFNDPEDLSYFIQRVEEFNGTNVVGGIYRGSLKKYQDKGGRLVNVVCYAFNPNHFHFLLSPLVENGVENFLHRLSTGHAMFFNNKHHRKGRLFQGVFKAVSVSSNSYLLHLSVYINLNDKIHQLRGKASQLSKTSWGNYSEREGRWGSDILLGDTSIITGQFKNPQEYKEFAEEILPDIIERKKLLKELEALTLEED